jgi:hypothetical protein
MKTISNQSIIAAASVLVEAAPVTIKNRAYGFHGTLHGNEHTKHEHLRKIIPHAKAALTTALAKHQAQDETHAKVFGIKTSAQERRKKMKVTNKTVGHFLDSTHGRHIADALNAGHKHHANPGSLASRAHHFMRDYEPKLHEEFDDGKQEITESMLVEKEASSVAAARSVYHAILQSKGHHTSSPEYIKLMQDFLAGYKNGDSIVESYELSEAKEIDGFWVVEEPLMISEAKVSGAATSDTHKIAAKQVRKHAASLKGTIHNLDHNEDGTSTLHVRHSPPQTKTIAKMVSDIRKEHGNPHEQEIGAQLHSKTKAAKGTAVPINIHTVTHPLNGGWYHTQLHFKPSVQKLKEEVELAEKTMTPEQRKKRNDIVSKMKKSDFEKYGDRAKEVMYATATKQALGEMIDETAFYDADDGTLDPLPLPDSETATTQEPGEAMQEATPSTKPSDAKKLTVESPILDADTDQIPDPQDTEGEDLPDGISEEFNSHEQASTRKEYLDKKHPRTVHEVVQGRRSGKYFVVRRNQHGAHVAEAVCFPDLESGGATQTMKTYDDPTKAIGEQRAECKIRRVNKIKSIVHSKE